MADLSLATAAEVFRGSDVDAMFRVGLAMHKADQAEALLDLALPASRQQPHSPRLYQLVGLAARTASRSREALTAFTAAARLLPNDPLIAHSHARTALEAGQPAVALFDHAAKLAPADGMVLLGRIAALVAEGQAPVAHVNLAQLVAENPGWLDGHRSLAHLRGQLGFESVTGLRRSLAAYPRHAELHRLHITLLLEARNPDAAQQAIDAARYALGAQPWLNALAAHVASERGDMALADRLFDAEPPATTISDASLRARHAIRSRRFDVVEGLAAQWNHSPDYAEIYPYRTLAWRAMGDARYAAYEGDAQLVSVHDLADRLGDLDRIAAHLRQLHFANQPPLDQSVRGGTQTDGNLLLRDDGVIGPIADLLRTIVAEHIAQLPQSPADSPALVGRARPIRFAGSWSVRLAGQGMHVDHVHNEGWVSSALYVTLPDEMGVAQAETEHSGWLSLGECRELLPELDPVRLVQPKPGRLVLFPSTMWHGTRAFSAGERLTIAFDIARPRSTN